MAFAKFMNKKDFHPGSKANIKRAWMAEQKALATEMKQKELQMQKEKEQQRFHNRQLVSKDERIKSGLDFLYDAPPGYKKEQEKAESDNKGEEVKFEWQKGAPREAYAKNLGLAAKDQPFGIPVRNVRCIKCGKWGHVNTDRECPMFNQQSTSDVDALDIADPMRLLKEMRSDGLTLKQNVLGRVYNPKDPNQQILASDGEDEDDPEAAFLASLTDKQKRKLLRKLDKMEQREGESGGHKKKKKKRKKNKDKGYSSGSDGESSEEGGEEDRSATKSRKRAHGENIRVEKRPHPRTDERDGRRRHRRTSSGREDADSDKEKPRKKAGSDDEGRDGRHRECGERSKHSRTDEWNERRGHRRTVSGRDDSDKGKDQRREKAGSDSEGANPRHGRRPRGEDSHRERRHDDRFAGRDRQKDRHSREKHSREKIDRERRR